MLRKPGNMREFSLFSFPHFAFFIFPVLNSSRSHQKIEKKLRKNGEKKKIEIEGWGKEKKMKVEYTCLCRPGPINLYKTKCYTETYEKKQA